MNYTKVKRIFLPIIILMLVFCSSLILFSASSNINVEASQEISNTYTLPTTKKQYTASELPSYFSLRDENIIFTANQGRLGLCWAFGATKAYETALALKYNEVYDVSEAWIGLCLKMAKVANNQSYQMGAGADFIDFVNAIQNYGVVLESDFPYESFHNFDETNMMEYFEYYSQFANKDMAKGVNVVDVFKLAGTKVPNSIQVKTQLKLQVINNGSSYIAFRSVDKNAQYTYSNGNATMPVYANTVKGSDHGITVIGWDDNITVTKKDGTILKGAWICLNSWGNVDGDGIVYIMYDDVSICNLYGFKIDDQNLESNLTMTKTTSYVKNLYKNYAKATYSNYTVERLKQGNMFYLGDDVDITYKSNVNTDKLDIEIFDGDKLSTQFDITKTSRTVNITSEDLTEGCYKVVISYDSNQDGEYEESYFKQIFMTSGIILDGIQAVGAFELPWLSIQPEQSGTEITYQDMQFVQAYSTQSVKFKNVYIATDFSSSTKVTVTMFIGSYSNINKYSIISNSINSTFSINKYDYKNALLNVNYSTGYLYFRVTTNELGSTDGNHTVKVLLQTHNGYSKTITFHFFATEEANNIVYLNYLTNINNVIDCPKILDYDNNIKTNQPISPNYQVFKGWFKNSDLTDSYDKSGSEYIISTNDVVKVSSKKHRLLAGRKFYYATLYPKFEDIPFEIKQSQILDEGTYNSTYSDIIDIVLSGSGKYEYTIISGEVPEGIQLVKNQVKGTPQSVGDFYFTVKIKDLILKEQRECSFSIKINKMTLEYHIPSYTIGYGDDFVNIEPELVVGTKAEASKANIKVVCQASANSDAGVYPISITTDNPNYNISFNTDATYTINPGKIKAKITTFNCQYDGNYHSIGYQLESNLNDAIVSYSLDNINYHQNLQFKDCTNGVKDVFIKIETSNKNYVTTYFKSQYKISQRILTIELLNDTLEYNFRVQQPNFVIKNAVFGETVNYTVTGASEAVGTHTLNFELLDPSKINYVFEESLKRYEITKITPKVEELTLDGDFLTENYFKDIKLPEGFSWQDPEKKVYTGKNTGYCTYYPEDLEIYNIVTNVKVSFNKQSIGDKYAVYAIVGAISLVIVTPLCFVGIRTLKRRKYR